MSDAATPTQIRRVEQFKDRWSAYSTNSGILEISEMLSPEELKRHDIFKEYDDKFLLKISPDITLAKWTKDAVLFEEGTYLDLAFFVVSGEVEVHLQSLENRAALGQPIFDPFRTRVFDQPDPDDPNKKAMIEPAQVDIPTPTILQTQLGKQEASGQSILFLSTLDVNIGAGDKLLLGQGEILGEIGALSGWPQSVTARTVSECELLQVRVAALRMMKRKSKVLKDRLDNIYRERALFSQLKSTPLLQKCDEHFLESLKEKVELVSCGPDEIITREGASADAFYIVRSGFVKLTQKFGEGEMVVSYLSKGMSLGEIELLIDGIEGWQYTARSVEYTELMKISRKDFVELCSKFPAIEKLLWRSAAARIKESGASRKNISQSEFLDVALHKGLVEGSSILVIDLNICTRCDDCVRGCAQTHNGVPRFVREGDKYKNFLITRACYHCDDPVCLVGCPTGAIRRSGVGQVVEIEDEICIGCQACAKSCPYDAITMFDTGDTWADNAIPAGNRGKAREIATKCDLCIKTNHGPACVSNCPHGCAVRVESVQEFQDLLAAAE